MADANFKVYGTTKEVQPVNKVIKPSRFQRDEDKDEGYESFASILTKEMAKKKSGAKDKKNVTEELRKMEGLNQYDARANAFIYRLSSTADYRA